MEVVIHKEVVATMNDIESRLGNGTATSAEEEAYFELSGKLNAILEHGDIHLTKEETDNGDYKVLHPLANSFSFEDGRCYISKIRQYED
jgi:hypothetical protein